jgi:HD-GYP domain-containing protein (c-di-GMP phosphodiesterase class II)
VAEIVLQDHERLNGSGYPQGLAGTAILMEAKIPAVADVVKSMAEITRNRGVLDDPEAVGACVKPATEKRFWFES